MNYNFVNYDLEIENLINEAQFKFNSYLIDVKNIEANNQNSTFNRFINYSKNLENSKEEYEYNNIFINIITLLNEINNDQSNEKTFINIFNIIKKINLFLEYFYNEEIPLSKNSINKFSKLKKESENNIFDVLITFRFIFVMIFIQLFRILKLIFLITKEIFLIEDDYERYLGELSNINLNKISDLIFRPNIKNIINFNIEYKNKSFYYENNNIYLKNDYEIFNFCVFICFYSKNIIFDENSYENEEDLNGKIMFLILCSFNLISDDRFNDENEQKNLSKLCEKINENLFSFNDLNINVREWKIYKFIKIFKQNYDINPNVLNVIDKMFLETCNKIFKQQKDINFELIKIRQELDSDKINKKTNNAFRKLFPQRKEELIKKKNQNENRLKEIEQKSKNLNLIVNSFLWFNNN